MCPIRDIDDEDYMDSEEQGYKSGMESTSASTADNCYIAIIGFEAIEYGDRYLKDEIEYRGLSQRKLAEKMGIAYSALNEILNGHRPLSEKTALLFEAALGVNAQPLLQIQLRYNLQTAKTDKTFMAKLARVGKVAAAL